MFKRWCKIKNLDGGKQATVHIVASVDDPNVVAVLKSIPSFDDYFTELMILKQLKGR